MIQELLSAVPGGAWPERCPTPPQCDYVVYFDDVDADGPDLRNMLFTHNVTVELYEWKRDSTTSAALEAELNARGIRWTKTTRRWQSSIQQYRTIYDFSYIEKE